MKLGINYDTGVFPGSRESRPVFHPEQVAFDMKAIARDLQCAAVSRRIDKRQNEKRGDDKMTESEPIGCVTEEWKAPMDFA